MKKRITYFILLAVLSVMLMMVVTGCEENAKVADSGGNTSVFTEGEVYAVTGEFDDHHSGGIVFGTLFVEILEVDSNWIRVDILEDDSVKRDLRESTITRAKEEGLFADLWINTDKIHHIMTEPDLSGL